TTHAAPAAQCHHFRVRTHGVRLGRPPVTRSPTIPSQNDRTGPRRSTCGLDVRRFWPSGQLAPHHRPVCPRRALPPAPSDGRRLKRRTSPPPRNWARSATSEPVHVQDPPLLQVPA